MYSKYLLFSAILYYFLCYYCKACLSVRNSCYTCINKLLLLLLLLLCNVYQHREVIYEMYINIIAVAALLIKT